MATGKLFHVCSTFVRRTFIATFVEPP